VRRGPCEERCELREGEGRIRWNRRAEEPVGEAHDRPPIDDFRSASASITCRA
jgi:hypothetical protein